MLSNIAFFFSFSCGPASFVWAFEPKSLSVLNEKTDARCGKKRVSEKGALVEGNGTHMGCIHAAFPAICILRWALDNGRLLNSSIPNNYEETSLPHSLIPGFYTNLPNRPEKGRVEKTRGSSRNWALTL